MAAEFDPTRRAADGTGASTPTGAGPGTGTPRGAGAGLRAVPDLLATLVREAGELFRTEGRLIRAELSDKLGQVQIAAGALAAGAICLLVSLFVLSQALIVAIAKYIDPAWAALAVGVGFAVIGALLLLKGKKDLGASSLTPDRTVRQLSKDTQLVKEQTR